MFYSIVLYCFFIISLKRNPLKRDVAMLLPGVLKLLLLQHFQIVGNNLSSVLRDNHIIKEAPGKGKKKREREREKKEN